LSCLPLQVGFTLISFLKIMFEKVSEAGSVGGGVRQRSLDDGVGLAQRCL
jgi:hypothetical protein